MNKRATALLLSSAIALSLGGSAFAAEAGSAQDQAPTAGAAQGAAVAQVAGGASYASLAEAVAAAPGGGTVTLLGDVDLDEGVWIEKSLTLDLGGYTLACDGNQTLSCAAPGDGSDVEITIKNGTVYAGVYYGVYAKSGTVNLEGCAVVADDSYAVCNLGATLTLEGCTVDAPDLALYALGGATLLEGTAVTVTADDAWAVYLANGAGRELYFSMDEASSIAALDTGIYMAGSNATLDIYGSVSVEYGYGISVGSLFEGDVVNVYDGASIVTEEGWAIYAASNNGSVNIYGGNVSGATGIEVRAGELNVAGGTIRATDEELALRPIAGGVTVAGVAVAVSQLATDDDVAVTVTGGELSGVYALYEADVQDDASDNVALSIEGGTFAGTAAALYSENCTGFVLGGTFSDEVPASYRS
jgi:hypothetical protein